jgi:DNA-binding PadR family transcriptional regulator
MAEDDDSAQRLQMLQREILSYLAQHPDAKDTVEGIMHWWLPGGDTGVRTSEVTAALDALVAQGWVTASSVGQGARVYGLDRAHQQEVREWLES